MKFQKCSIAIHPIIAELKPELLVKLMTLDHYCYPLKTYTPFKGNSTEYGPKCTLYFKKKLSKAELRKLREFKYPKGLFVHFGNTYDNPCFIHNGHSSEYAVTLYELTEVIEVVKELIREIRIINN